MNRILTHALFVGLIVGTGAAALNAGGPAWLSPTALPPASVYRTQYPEFPRATAGGPQAPADPRPLIVVLDGAGDLRGCSSAMLHVNGLAGNPAELSVFSWSHGYRRLLLDQTDTAHTRTQGVRLAQRLCARRAREPARRIVLVAHSAGAAVALAACDTMPPDTIDRVILLAPAVSVGYDVRPAVRSAREGMDVFCSKKDWLALGFVTRVVGTTDGRWAPAAGRHGFKEPAPDVTADRFRQHFWSADVAWTGNTGGHHGAHAPGFIQAYLFPLIGLGGREQAQRTTGGQ